jgi:hypothetical protein
MLSFCKIKLYFFFLIYYFFFLKPFTIMVSYIYKVNINVTVKTTCLLLKVLNFMLKQYYIFSQCLFFMLYDTVKCSMHVLSYTLKYIFP